MPHDDLSELGAPLAARINRALTSKAATKPYTSATVRYVGQWLGGVSYDIILRDQRDAGRTMMIATTGADVYAVVARLATSEREPNAARALHALHEQLRAAPPFRNEEHGRGVSFTL